MFCNHGKPISRPSASASTDDPIVGSDSKNGPEAWRQLSLRYDPIGESYVFDTIGSLMKVPRCKQLTDLPAALTNWERAQKTFFERTGGQAIPLEWKLTILFDMIPTNMLSDLKIKHKYTQGVDKTYEGFSKLLIEMAHEKHYDRRAAKGRGESDMDVDALAAEKAERQAELQAADDEDYGENQEYTEAEWLDWETHLQEELNYLGPRQKGGKGGKSRKGDRRKGKGKGREGGGGKGKGDGSGCTWCGDPDHWRADCEKLKKHKSDMDADRKKRGLPAFVPRPRSVNSLEPEERRKVTEDNDEDYEVTGLMCDSDGDCDCIEIGSRENTFGICGGNPSESETFSDYEFMCCVCEADEEIATIQLDASRVVLLPLDEAGMPKRITP